MEGELEIIKGCQEGRSQDFTLLYETYVRKIYDFLYFRTFHKETAEDLTSDTFLKVLRSIKRFDPLQAAFSTWIYTIARNTLIDYVRTKKETDDLSSYGNIGERKDIEGALDAKEGIKEVRQILEQFPEEQRDIIVMRLWDDLSYREIASIVGKSEDACKMTFSRGMKMLRNQLPALSFLLLFILSKRI